MREEKVHMKHTMYPSDVYLEGYEVPPGYHLKGFRPPKYGELYLGDYLGYRYCRVNEALSDYRMPRLVIQRDPKIVQEIARLKARLQELEEE